MNLGSYDLKKLKKLGCEFGDNLQLSSLCVLVNPHKMKFRNNVRIDAFCILSANDDGIEIGDNVHVSAGCYLFGGGGKILLESFSGLSAGVKIYTGSDDYLGNFLTNPTVPDEFRNLKLGPVSIRRHAIIGPNCIVLPGVDVGAAASVTGNTIIRKNVKPESVNVSGRRVATRCLKTLDELAEKIK